MLAPASTVDFDFEGVNAVLARLDRRARDFLAGPAAGSASSSVEFFAEARYPDQVWELEVPLRSGRVAGPADVETLRSDFHATHRDSFAVADERSPVEIITWGVRARGRIRTAEASAPLNFAGGEAQRSPVRRPVFFAGGWVEAAVYSRDSIPADLVVDGPAIVESASTTIVVPAGSLVTRGSLGSLLMTP